MAFVVSIEKDKEKTVRSTHPTRLICSYFCNETDNGTTMFQINSYGSEERDIPGKLSQTLQFDESSAKQLYEALAREFGF